MPMMVIAMLVKLVMITYNSVCHKEKASEPTESQPKQEGHCHFIHKLKIKKGSQFMLVARSMIILGMVLMMMH